MKIEVPLTKAGLLPDRYGKYASLSESYQSYPVISPPIALTDLPTGTNFLALKLLDYDAVPVGGFVWIHWLATNIPLTTEIIEDASRKQAKEFIQGSNSNAGHLVHLTNSLITHRYVGPQPPDKTHNYELTVYALARPLPLQDGYWYNEFRNVLSQNVLASATIILPSRA